MLRCSHCWLFCYQHSCQVSQDLSEMERLAALVVKREGFIRGLHCEKIRECHESRATLLVHSEPIWVPFEAKMLQFCTTPLSCRDDRSSSTRNRASDEA